MLYVFADDQGGVYRKLLRAALPGWEIEAWPAVLDADEVTHVAAWAPPPGFFAPFRNLRTIFNLGAGVDKLLARDDVPPGVEIVRLTDAGMAAQMTEYCLYGVLHYQREMDVYRRQQQAAVWQQHDARLRASVRISVLGLGELGRRVAGDLARMGYPVRGWSRSAHRVDGVTCVHGEAALDTVLRDTDVLRCLLPATNETRHLLDARRLALLPCGAALINAGRGSLVDESALLFRLDSGDLRFAVLGVFAEDPLPAAHPFWRHPRVILTPHVAADTVPAIAVDQIVAKLCEATEGRPMSGLVNRERGY